jgi:hypothetical protein
MKKYLLTLFVATLALVFLSSMSYSQSRETGALEGKVIDSEGNPLPGAEVKISSPNMIGGARSRVTEADGKYRFVGLQPGTYTIEASIAGFASERKEGIRVFVAMTVTVDFVLKIKTLEEEVTVTATHPLIDVKDSQMATRVFDDKAIKDIAFSREYYLWSIIDLAPATTPIYHGSTAYGGVGRTDNAYLVDGVEVSEPTRGRTWSIWDSNAFEEAKVQGLGASAEYDGYMGVALTTVTKSGGNTFDGMGLLYYSDYHWLKNNVDLTEPKYKLFKAPLGQRWYDIRFNMGGPIITDKLWLFGSVVYYNIGSSLWDSLANKIQKWHQDQPSYQLKLTFQATPSTRIVTLYHFDDYRYDNTGASIFRPREAQGFEYCHTYVFNISGFHSFSDKTFMEVKFGLTDDGNAYGGYQGKDVAGHFNAYTRMYSVNSNYYDTYPDLRDVVNLSISHHADDFIKGSHDFKFGAEWERVETKENWGYNGGFFYVDQVYSFADQKFHNFAYQYSWSNEPIGNRVSFFAQDSWKVAKNLTINPGIRYNVFRATPREGVPFNMSGFAPRIGFSWDIFGKHTTAVKAQYGRYFDKFSTSKFSAASANINDKVMYEVMPNGSKVEVLRTKLSNPAKIDSKIGFPCVDQFTIGIQRELMRDTSAGISFVWRNWKNFLYRINSGAKYQLVQFNYKDEKGIPGTAVAYNKTSPSSADTFLITNPKAGIYDSIIADPQRKWWGIIFEFEKRFSNRWMINASYTFSKLKATSTNADPNRQLNEVWNGKPVDYPFHNVKIYGSVVLPFEITISPTFVYMTGGRWTRNVTAPVRGNPTINIEKPNLEKYSDVINFDLRAEKTFKFTGDFRVGFIVDLYNALNLAQDTGVVSQVTSPNYGLVNNFNLGRQLRVGIRFYF